MKKICVDESRCICCGACFSTDPEHFTLGENDKSNVISNENLDSTNLQNAIEFCPTAAISIVECDDNCTEECHCTDECNCDESCECENCHKE